MLRITVVTDKQGTTLQLEGRLVDRMIKEAERSWRAVRDQKPKQPIRLDLTSVTYIDAEGKTFLRQAHQQGAQLVASGCLTRAYVDEITRSVKEGGRCEQT